jgi:hypothetical protein
MYNTLKPSKSYLIGDIILDYVKAYCLKARRLVFTNGDNLYSPRFFTEVLRQTADVVYTNMLERGLPFQVSPKRQYIDLGASAISLSYLREKSLNFWAGIPEYPRAPDFHDADGLFIEKLIHSGATTFHVREYLFMHE